MPGRSCRTVRLMLKLTVLYTRPSDVDAFESHYTGVHVPLVAALPGLVRSETAVFVGTPDGSPAPFHRIAELYFQDAAAMDSAFGTEQGRATAADAQELSARTGATVTMAVAAVD